MANCGLVRQWNWARQFDDTSSVTHLNAPGIGMFRITRRICVCVIIVKHEYFYSSIAGL